MSRNLKSRLFDLCRRATQPRAVGVYVVPAALHAVPRGYPDQTAVTLSLPPLRDLPVDVPSVWLQRNAAPYRGRHEVTLNQGRSGVAL
jgi:hypothetical protein